MRSLTVCDTSTSDATRSAFPGGPRRLPCPESARSQDAVPRRRFVFFRSGRREGLGGSDHGVKPARGAEQKGGGYERVRETKGGTVKYMIMMFGDQNTMMETKTPEWIRNMIGYMKT